MPRDGPGRLEGATVAIYRLILTLAMPGLIIATLVAQRRGRLPEGALAERLGWVAAPSGRKLWLHGASLGEITSARWLIERLLAEVPDLRILVTSNTATARDMVQGWKLARVTAALAPFDAGAPSRRLLKSWAPAALIILENELWPIRIAAASFAGVPVVVIGARLSARSARRWRMAPGLIAATLSRISWLSAQDTASQERLLALGLPKDRLGPCLMLKSLGHGAVVALPAGRARVLLAASTHPGEDAPILDAFCAARGAGLFDRLILAPRHPSRAAEIAALIAARGLAFTAQSRGEAPDAPVHLADTLGEMPRWYAMAGTTVIGGTLQDHGGHTPFEPAAHGSAIVHGPHVGNFEAAFAALTAAKGALRVTGAEGLATALLQLDPAAQASLAAAARVALAPTAEPEVLLTAIRHLARL